MPNLNDTTTIIDAIRAMTSRQLAVVIVLAASAVATAFWFENRYAKLKITQDNIQQQQTQIIQLQTQILNVVNALPADVRKEIVERSQTQQALNVNKERFISQ